MKAHDDFFKSGDIRTWTDNLGFIVERVNGACEEYVATGKTVVARSGELCIVWQQVDNRTIYITGFVVPELSQPGMTQVIEW